MSYAWTHFFGTGEAAFHPYRQARGALKESIRKYLLKDKRIKKYTHTYTHTSIHIYIYAHTLIYNTYKHILLFISEKEEKPTICNNMNEAGRRYGKQRKQDIIMETVHDLTYLWNLKLPTSWNQSLNGKCQDLGRGGHGVMLVKGYKFSVMQDKQVLDVLHCVSEIYECISDISTQTNTHKM